MTRYAYFLLLLIAISPTALLAADPFGGTWTMDLKSSKYAPGQLPKRMVIQMETAGRGVHYRSETTFADGKSTFSEYTADYGGSQVIVMSSGRMMAPVSLKQIDPHTVEASYMKGLVTVATSRRVVSADGRTMTITTTSTDAEGKTVTNIGVYRKSADAAGMTAPAASTQRIP